MLCSFFSEKRFMTATRFREFILCDRNISDEGCDAESSHLKIRQ